MNSSDEEVPTLEETKDENSKLIESREKVEEKEEREVKN